MQILTSVQRTAEVVTFTPTALTPLAVYTARATSDSLETDSRAQVIRTRYYLVACSSA